MIHTLLGNPPFIQYLTDKKATFLLALSNTATANIQGITQAGIPNMIHLTPTLDSEFLCTGEVKSLGTIAETPKGVPTPALITRAVHLLSPFGRIELLDLGLEVQPKGNDLNIHHFDIKPSDSIATKANIDAKALFEKGKSFGENYHCKDDYILLGESVPSGTSTATATALALGYDAKALFSSSFKNVPNNIRQETISQALSHITDENDIYDKLGKVSDNMLIFNAGLLYGLDPKTKIVLAGGTQMAGVLLVLNSILKHEKLDYNSQNLALATTQWVAKDKHSNIKVLLEILDFPINAYYSDFDFSKSQHPALKLYDQGEAKEGVGAGGALVYGYLNGLSQEEITKKVEAFLA